MSRLPRRPFWGSLLAAFALVLPAHADSTAVVDPAARGQVLEGWGTSLCWWANVIGGFPQNVQRDYLTKIFDVKKGLGLNIVRYNIGGGENPHIPNTLQVRARVPGFEPTPGVWDWNADANQRRVLQEAIKSGVTIEEAFSNSPPWWMTLSGSVAGAPDGGANLKPDDFGLFANYLTAVVQHYHDHWGITFRTLEPMNESATYWWKKGGNQEGYHIDPHNAQGNDQNRLVQTVAAALKQRDLSTRVSAPDENTIDLTLTSVRSYTPDTLSDIGQINTHTYGGSQRAALKAFADSHSKPLWVSEHGDGDASGMQMAADIIADFKQMGITGWVYWQVVDGGGWGMLSKDNNDTSSYTYSINEKYYIMGQFSRFLRPGDRFLGVSDDNTLAAYRPSAGTLTLVTLNNSDTATQVTYDLSRFTRFGGTMTATRTSATEQWATVPVPVLTNLRFTAPAPAKSVTTYTITKLW